MDLSHLRIDDEASQLSDVQNWDYPEDGSIIERLAPGQCARFTTNANSEPIEGCFAEGHGHFLPSETR
jgi:hypothetical protein